MIDRIDHIVLSVRSIEDACSFYERVFCMERRDEPGKPTSLVFGHCKINLHEVDHLFEPKARVPTLGSADFCLITGRPIEEIRGHLERCDVAVELGPVERSGVLGKMCSLYLRDPDGNLVEVACYNRPAKMIRIEAAW